MSNKVLIKEIFESVQGEGPYIGVNQLFIRFSKCNLNCEYCDTDFKDAKLSFSADELSEEINKHSNIHSISLTGGEPLLEVDFLAELLKKINKKIYLETNGTLVENLKKIVNNTDIISMDVKLPSCSNNKPFWAEHKKFIETALNYNKEIFLKVVFDENICDEEIKKVIELAALGNILIVLQPKFEGKKMNIPPRILYEVFSKFIKLYNNVRLIPQVHKYLNVQ